MLLLGAALYEIVDIRTSSQARTNCRGWAILLMGFSNRYSRAIISSELIHREHHSTQCRLIIVIGNLAMIRWDLLTVGN